MTDYTALAKRLRQAASDSLASGEAPQVSYDDVRDAAAAFAELEAERDPLDLDAIAAGLRRRNYWQFDMVLGDDGGHEATFRTREGYLAMGMDHTNLGDKGND